MRAFCKLAALSHEAVQEVTIRINIDLGPVYISATLLRFRFKRMIGNFETTILINAASKQYC